MRFANAAVMKYLSERVVDGAMADIADSELMAVIGSPDTLRRKGNSEKYLNIKPSRSSFV